MAINFLNEEKGTVTTDDPKKAKELSDQGANVKLVKQGSMSEKRGEDLDGDGDVDSQDYLAARDAAIKKTKARKKTNEAISLDKFKKIPVGAEVTTQGTTSTVEDNDGYRLKLSNGMTVNYAQFNQSGIVREDRGEKAAAFIRKIGGAQYKTTFSDFIKNIDDFIKNKGNSNTELQKLAKKLANIESMTEEEFNTFIKELGKSGYDKKELERLKKRYKEYQKNKKNQPTNENKKTVELPTDTTFTLDLKHLMKKHMDEGKSQKDAIKLTKKLMAKLHDKGEVKVDGTKVTFKENVNEEKYMVTISKNGTTTEQNIHNTKEAADAQAEKINGGFMDRPGVKFKAVVSKYIEEGKKKKSGYMGYTEMAEADVPMDMSVDLPEPEAEKPRRKGPPRLVAFDTDQDSHYLGDDDYDYEGGMAKSQMLKMKKYANALCDMIEDESQLEAWVQSKITKASDYMSSVYHYLDYQRSKMDEINIEDPGAESRFFDRKKKYALAKKKENHRFFVRGKEINDIYYDTNIDGSPYISGGIFVDGEELTDSDIDNLYDEYEGYFDVGGHYWEMLREINLETPLNNTPIENTQIYQDVLHALNSVATEYVRTYNPNIDGDIEDWNKEAIEEFTSILNNTSDKYLKLSPGHIQGMIERDPDITGGSYGYVDDFVEFAMSFDYKEDLPYFVSQISKLIKSFKNQSINEYIKKQVTNLLEDREYQLKQLSPKAYDALSPELLGIPPSAIVDVKIIKAPKPIFKCFLENGQSFKLLDNESYMQADINRILFDLDRDDDLNGAKYELEKLMQKGKPSEKEEPTDELPAEAEPPTEEPSTEEPTEEPTPEI